MNLKIYLRGLGVGIIVTALVLGLSGRNHTMTDAQIKARAAELGMVEDKGSQVLSDLQEPVSDDETKDDADAEDETDGNTSAKAEAAGETAPAGPATVSQEATVSDDTEHVTDDTEGSSVDTGTEPSEADENAEPEEVDDPEAQETGAVQGNTLDNEDANSTLGGNKNTNSSAANANNTTTNNNTANSGSDKTVRITVNAGDTSWPVARRVAMAGLVEDASEFDDYLCDNGYAGFLRAGVYEIPVGSTQEQIAKILAQR